MEKKQVYIHYGCTQFQDSLFKAPRNYGIMCKPHGGFWACPEDAELSWKAFVDGEEDLFGVREGNCLRFTLSDNANTFHISSVEDLAKLPRQPKSGNSYFWDVLCWDDPVEYVKKQNEADKCIQWVPLDFEQMVRDGIDAVELHLSGHSYLYQLLYTWDVDSILILNPKIIQQL